MKINFFTKFYLLNTKVVVYLPTLLAKECTFEFNNQLTEDYNDILK